MELAAVLRRAAVVFDRFCDIAALYIGPFSVGPAKAVVSVKIQQKARVKDEERKGIVVDSGGGTRRLVEVKV